MKKITERKLIENKKGDFNVLIAMIVIIIAGIILIAFFAYLMIMSKSVSDTEKCRMSALAKWKSRIMGQESPVDLRCKTDFLMVYDGRVEKDGKVIQKLDTRLGNDQINRVIANEMYDCWYQLGAGNYDVLGGGSSKCVVCAYVDFDESFRTDNARLSGLNEMLTKKIPGHNISYIDYMSKGAISNEEIKGTEINLDTSKSYVVTYIPISSKGQAGDFISVYNSNSCKGNAIKNTGGNIDGVFSACGNEAPDNVIIGTQETGKTLHVVGLVQAEFLGEQCTIMY